MSEMLESPTISGWWWCIPDPACGWHQDYPGGVFVEVGEIEGYDLYSDRFYASLTGTDNVVGLTGDHPSDLFGIWCGPIPAPVAAQCTWSRDKK